MALYLVSLALIILAFVAGWFVGGHNSAAVIRASADAAVVQDDLKNLQAKTGL
jgi:hypothetical protein